MIKQLFTIPSYHTNLTNLMNHTNLTNLTNLTNKKRQFNFIELPFLKIPLIIISEDQKAWS